MSHKQPKPVFSIVVMMLFMGIIAVSCNNSADSSKAMEDTASKMTSPKDTIMKVDTLKMDTAATRPVKTNAE